MTDTQSLIARLEAATGPDRELDAAIAVLVDWRFPDWEEGDLTPKGMAEKNGLPWLIDRMENGWTSMWRHIPAFTASIDAALTLVKASNAGFVVIVLEAAIRMWRDNGSEDISDLPRFIVIAALRAKGDA